MSRRLLPALAVATLAAGCADAGKPMDMPSDWEIQNERFLKGEDIARVPEPPAYPRTQDLVSFLVPSRSDYRFFVDRRSISVDGGIVRYSLVARSPQGADNVSFEALNCREREFRSYSRGAGTGRWISRATEWRRIEPGVHPAQFTLHREYLCPHRIAVQNAAEGVSALEAGGHPSMSRSLGGG